MSFLSLLPLVGVVASLLVAERLCGVRETDWLRNLLAWVLSLTAAIVFVPLWPSYHAASLIDGARLPFWLGFPLYLVIYDLGEYLYHRAQHKIPLLWAMHSLHHSDPAMSALTTSRHFWGDQLVKTLTIWAASAMIISPGPAFVGAYGVASLWNFFAHAALPVSFGKWSWVINAPAYHRRHHSRLPEHYDSNFAALFPVFDVIAGSYFVPDGFPPTGLDQRPKSTLDVVIWPVRYWQRSRKPVNDLTSATA